MGISLECMHLDWRSATTTGLLRKLQKEVQLHQMPTFCSRKDEKQSTLALQINRRDCWATHAKAHVLEMEGRAKEGIHFLESTVEDWKGGGGLACHNFWHLGEFWIWNNQA